MPMAIRDGIVDAIGDTPLIRLRRASEATGCTILGKAEFMNPGQSVKDRPAKQMILEAEKRGDLKQQWSEYQSLPPQERQDPAPKKKSAPAK